MTDYTLSIPADLYQQAQRLAEQNAQPLDDLILERLADGLRQSHLELPDDETAELQALRYLSDDTLWTIAREQMSSTKQSRLSGLMDKHTAGTITDAELIELTALVESSERLTLRKAEAMRLLLDRGYTIRLDDLKPNHE